MDFIHTGWNCAILTIGQTAKKSSSAGVGSNSSAAFKTLLHSVILVLRDLIVAIYNPPNTYHLDSILPSTV